MTPAAKSDVMKFERKYWDALVDGDGETLAKLSADPCLVTNGMGVRQLEPKALGKLMRDSPSKLTSYKVDESSVQVRALGDSVASVAYRVSQRYEQAGKISKTEALDTSLWVKDGADWKCAVHTETMAR
jgi:hypothetical protein